MYAKVFTQIFDSSLADDWQVRHVFEDLLKLCDVNGVVDVTMEAISRRTNVPLEIVARAISVLESPDPKSRTPDEDGRRIVRLDEHRAWGWSIVNYRHYRNLVSEEQRREKTKSRVRKFRKKSDAAPCNTDVTPRNTHVTLGNACNAMQREMERKKDKDIPEVQGEDGEVAAPAAVSEHSAFIKSWCENFEAAHKVKYQFQEGKDGKAVKELLKMGILRIDLLEIAKKAWAWKGNLYLSGRSLTIHGFRMHFNEINTGVTNGQSGRSIPAESKQLQETIAIKTL